MKKLKYRIIIPTALIIAVTIVACSKDFLNKPPLGTLNPTTMSGEAGIQGLLIGAYSLVDGEGASGDGFASGASNWFWGGIAGDDAYKGSDPSDVGDGIGVETWTIASTNGALPQKWNLCYAGAQRCNQTLNTLALNEASDAPLDPDIATGIKAQTRFLRAYFMMEAMKVFGNIIYADESVNPANTEVTNTDKAGNMTKLYADLDFAIANLPPTWSEVGRVNVWAAKALKAKALMFEGKLSDAYPILQDLIANGKTSKGDKYALNDNYWDNFNPAQKNSKESVFAAQTSVQDGSSVDWGGDPNGNYGDILNFPYNGGPGGCCGFYNPSQDLADAYKTDANGLPLLDTWYQGLDVSDPAGPYVGNLDPRIDWVMGREPIPYLDWGPHPGDDWIRNVVADGHFSPKKNVYAASQKGAFTDVGSAYWGPTQLVANNVNIIRFADIKLWAAECAVAANDITTAMNHVNDVRKRVVDHPATWVKKDGTYDAGSGTYSGTTNADTYKIGLYTAATFTAANALKAVQFERRLELAMEGHRFFDLVRWGIAAQTLNPYNDRSKLLRPYRANAVFTAGKNEIQPIPQGSIDNMNQDGVTRLQQNPGY